MAGKAPVARTAEWIERDYGREKWPAVDRLVSDAMASDHPPLLSRVLREVARQERPSSEGQEETVLGGATIRLPPAVAWAAHDGMVVESVIAACGPTTDL